MAVVNQKDELVLTLKKPTSEQQLITSVKLLRQKAPVSLVVEESHMAGWCQEVLRPRCDEFVVCDPRQNKLISSSELCNDKEDAIKLARLLRAGFIKPIVHPEGQLLKRRELFLHYHRLAIQNAANKMKLKARFRMNAVSAKGKGVYNTGKKDLWLERLSKNPTAQFQADQYYELIRVGESLKEATIRHLKNELKSLKEYTVLRSFPGIGDVTAAGLICMIGTPHRFSKKNKLWKYAGFGIKSQESDGAVYVRKASKAGNRVLKWVVSEIVRACLRCKEANGFKAKYVRLVTKGLSDRKAKRTIARDILSAVRRAWINGECFRYN